MQVFFEPRRFFCHSLPRKQAGEAPKYDLMASHCSFLYALREHICGQREVPNLFNFSTAYSNKVRNFFIPVNKTMKSHLMGLFRSPLLRREVQRSSDFSCQNNTKDCFNQYIDLNLEGIGTRL
jgi:hypothetical protein